MERKTFTCSCGEEYAAGKRELERFGSWTCPRCGTDNDFDDCIIKEKLSDEEYEDELLIVEDFDQYDSYTTACTTDESTGWDDPMELNNFKWEW